MKEVGNYKNFEEEELKKMEQIENELDKNHVSYGRCVRCGQRVIKSNLIKYKGSFYCKKNCAGMSCYMRAVWRDLEK